MKKQGKAIIIGISSFIAVGTGIKTLSPADEKLSTASLKNNPEEKNLLLKPATVQTDTLFAKPIPDKKVIAKAEPKTEKKPKKKFRLLSPEKRKVVDHVVNTGLSYLGTPYIFGGTSERGFDCSGFVYYAFRKFNIEVPRSSRLLAEAGRPVKPEETRKGDILIFTGTNSKDRTPGHVGIVISRAGEPVRFVHSSSNGGVKISEVEGTNYERRFLETRRVL